MREMVEVGVGPKREKNCIEAETQNRPQEKGDGGWGCAEHPVGKQCKQRTPGAEDGRKEWEKTPSDRKDLRTLPKGDTGQMAPTLQPPWS